MRLLLMIAVGSVLGAFGRYALSLWLNQEFFWGTLAVNALGCGLGGYILAHSLNSSWLQGEWGTAITVGFLGSLTTFSTFTTEIVRCLQAGQWTFALAYFFLTPIVAMTLALGGFFLGRQF